MPTILIIDDSPTHRAEIRRSLESEHTFDCVLEAADGLLGLKLLLSEKIDLVICDLEMPGIDGEKLLRIKEQRPSGSKIPFIFLTASQNIERRARLLNEGASDVVTKPFHSLELVARVRLHYKVHRLQDELRIKNETLARLSTTDSVTGLRTRRYATEALSIEYLRAHRYRSPLTVLMADLDHFKRVNDKYGHPAGDAVLRGVSSSLLSNLRATDIAGRYGGEEIMVMLVGNERAGALTVAERWRAAVANAGFELPDGRTARVTISIGAAAFSQGMESPEELVAAADAALYRAKEAGRNRVEAAPVPE